MSRTCMKCGIKGHNSRSCSSIKDYYWSTHTKQLQLDNNNNNKPTIELERRSTSTSLKLFGVHLLDHHHDHDLSSSNSSSISVARKRKGPIASMASPHLTSSTVSGYQSSPYTGGIYRNDRHGLLETKYMIKRVEWSEEEHRRFLEGIEKLGKGDWRGISRHYVTTRSPIQIASHSQNYFLRLQNTTTTGANSMMNNQDCDSDPSKQVCRRRRPKLFYGRPRDINIYKPNGTEASVDRRPDDQHSTPLPINVNSSFQSASAAAEGLDLDLKLAATSYYPRGVGIRSFQRTN